MALEVLGEQVIMSPGPIDVHAHPRVFDSITLDAINPLDKGMEGKAGLVRYSQVAMRSGLVAMIAMPNESLRLYLPEKEITEAVPYLITNEDRILAMLNAVSTQSYISAGVHMGVDPKEILRGSDDNKVLDIDRLRFHFLTAGTRALSVKLYGAETTGGHTLAKEFIPSIVKEWSQIYPDKPAVLHLEDQDVRSVLEEVHAMENGDTMPIHIAHVSSLEELEAVIWAKEQGMNVTCEVTPHHVTLTSDVREELGGYGCMKPTLKSEDDIRFILENLKYVDIFASDCAPHRISDKEAKDPAYGVTNHTVMLPIFLGLVEQGHLTMQELYEKTCVNPRRRFNLIEDDGSSVRFDLSVKGEPASYYEQQGIDYQASPYTRTNRQVLYVGRVGSMALSNGYSNSNSRPSYKNLILPKKAA